MIQSVKDLCALLDVTFSELKTICSNIDGFYRKKEQVIKGKNRIFYPSRKKLRRIQDRLVEEIFSKYSFPTYVTGGVKGRDNVRNALLHRNKKYKFQTDLKDFFKTVSYKSVYNLFVTQGYPPQVARWLTKLTTYKGSLPQGVPTSTYIANLIFLPIDSQFSSFCEENEISYSRFVDDLTFSSSKDFKILTLYFIDEIFAFGFKINNKKTKYRIKTTITGVGVKYNLFVTNPIKDKIKEARANNNLDKLQGLISYQNRILRLNK